MVGTQVLGWLISVSVLLMTTVLLALLSGADVPPPALAWLGQYIPNWLQAVATIVGVLIAWEAYREWSQPELARAKATQAKELLMEVDEFARGIKMARQPSYTFRRPVRRPTLERLFSDTRRQCVRDCRTRTQRLDRKLITVLDEDAQKEIGKLVEIGGKISEAFGTLEYYCDEQVDENDELEEFEREEMVESLKVLGIRERHKDEVDELGRELEATVTRLREIFRSQMEFK